MPNSLKEKSTPFLENVPLTFGEVKIFLSVVIPAYNEEKRLPPTLEHLIHYFDSKSYRVEIIVVDDGSQDQTRSVVKDFQNKVPYLHLIEHPHNRGKGACLQTGFQYAHGRYALMYDADMAVPIQTLDEWLREPVTVEHIIIGSRNAVEEGVIRRFNPIRRFVSLVFQKISQWLVPQIQDTQCGFKLFPEKIYHLLASLQKEHGFSVDLEYLMLAQRYQFTIEERGVSWENRAGSKVNILTDSWKMLYAIFRIKWRSMRRVYD